MLLGVAWKPDPGVESQLKVIPLEQPARAWCRLAGDPIQKHRDAQRASDYRPSLGEQDDAGVEPA